MEMYYLLIAMTYYSASISISIIPEKYTKEQCEQAGLASGKQYVCVKAPPNQPFSTWNSEGWKNCKQVDSLIICDNVGIK